MKTRTLFIGYAVILLFALSPIISVAIAGTIASTHGCTLHEGFSNPCIVAGRDMGETLYAMGVMGWFMLATIPLGGIAFVLWTIVYVIMLRRRNRQTAAPAGTAS